MNIDADKFLINAIREGISGALKAKLEGYNSPLDSTIKACISRHENGLHSLINDAISSCILDDAFRDEVRSAARQSLARMLIKRLGGEIEKQVNSLKSDPRTRARITTAIDAITEDALAGKDGE